MAAFQEQLWWLLPVLIVALAGLIGLGDVLKFSWGRVWAISGVCFAESMRRRVLLVAPLAMAGVILVSQFTRSFDELDAVRQATKFCLFAAGLVVTLTVVILACTSLPKEIESRVIYTIVTKPTTRLEIVLGKVVGFARVSGLVLLLLGLFSWGFLSFKAWRLEAGIRDRLETGLVDVVSKPTLEHYLKYGLLSARRLESARDFQVYSSYPKPEDQVRWTFPAPDNDILFPFVVNRSAMRISDTLTAAIVIEADVAARQARVAKTQESDFTGPYVFLPETFGGDAASPTPVISIAVLDVAEDLLIGSESIEGGSRIPLNANGGKAVVSISPTSASGLLNKDIFWVQITGLGQGWEYGTGTNGVKVYAVNPQTGQPIAKFGSPEGIKQGKTRLQVVENSEPYFRGREGTRGMQLRGTTDPLTQPMAVYRFLGADLPKTGEVGGEFRMLIERSGAELNESEEATKVRVEIRPHNGAEATTVAFSPESNRPAFFSAPASSFGDGNFDLVVRCDTGGHYLGMFNGSLNVVGERQFFAFNLLKSLAVLWLMSLLVVAISVFCSTFLSWPIAVMLTVLILLGRWGVEQLGDSLNPGVGNLVATDLGFKDAATSKAVSASVEALSRMLTTVASVLPDISKFAFIEDLERGQLLGMMRLTDALGMAGLFAIPMIALAYVFLRNKEVAP